MAAGGLRYNWQAQIDAVASTRAIRCNRGHNVLKEGVYIHKTSVRGETYTCRRCRRCRIEDVQNWRERHALKRAA